ncbi:Uroporphyrinogen-III methylase [Candidatus Terasakiella magnetica]|uniref:uroporphyrinogen-III C-methyltransferase n=1 Tax=Candidatus Terasakiella magnetica TaxID=1867952 RepID=A0A1C3RK45_9PROT|nr:uroporphyrinogen-III C-methyltransferase [Candidatus Terasakiella magnetica]SCA57648.1 Uroporphyrinogen-III methylase [Candidatus Terasakiella magnetica]
MPDPQTQKGHVVLVGAGPGDPDLLTLRALNYIQKGDVIVHDRLVSDDILSLVPEGVEKVFVGKAPGRHILKQDEINDLLVELANKHKLIIRLKGGDPFVFGRGSEEAEYLLKHGISYDVVPGITAAAGCGAAARIPLTHRGMARSVRFITGHHKEGHGLDIDWASLADPEMTVVIYMGLKNLNNIVANMVQAGRAPDTPAAIVENGATDKQRIAYTTLGNLPTTRLEGNFKPPSLLIVGQVVEVAKILNND